VDIAAGHERPGFQFTSCAALDVRTMGLITNRWRELRRKQDVPGARSLYSRRPCASRDTDTPPRVRARFDSFTGPAFANAFR
ncbi:MAG: hypothetical protein WCF41_03625, partial [Pseudolabrys sp.]